jgi:VCBS repeat-containing protein
VVVNITGTNDAAVITEAAGADHAVVEAGGVNNGTAGDPSASGTLSVSDVDDGESSFQAAAAADLAGTYGTFTFNAATGAWTYTLDNTRAATQALNQGDPASDTLTVHSADGTSYNVVVNITGTNDAAVITGATSGFVTEDAVPNTVTGDLNSTDVDGTADSWTAVSSPTASANGYGTFTIDASGHWSYALDNTNTTVNALNNGGTLSDSFTVTTADGTSKVVSITINGHTDVTDTQAPTDIIFNLAASTGTLNGNGINMGMTLGSFTAVDVDSTSWSFTIGSVTGQTLPAVTITPGSGGTVNLVTNGSIAAGQYGFSVTATDSAGHSYTENYTLSVGTTNGDGSAAFTITDGTAATNGTDISLGLQGGDTIKGGGGDDALVGGSGADFLYGGLGNDQLIGGQGNDTFVFDTALGSGNVDTILDFSAGGNGNQAGDMIQLDHAVFTGLSVGALSAGISFVSNTTGAASGTHAQIIFNSSTGDLYYDADGTGAQGAILFAHLDLAGFTGTLDPSDFNVV